MNLQIEPEKIKQLIADLEAEANEDKLGNYKPYLKQAEFHGAGARHRERLLMAGNRIGKTLCGAAETAFHLTGDYPDWWVGKRFDRPVRAWAAACPARRRAMYCRTSWSAHPSEKPSGAPA